MTPEEIKAAQDKVNARVEELKKLSGQPFRRKDGKGGIITVIEYAGIFTKGGQSFHSLLVEGDQMRWKPSAKEFLETYEPTVAPAAESNKEVI